MKLSDLDNKFTDKAYRILSNIIKIQKDLDFTRIDDLRKKSKNILQSNGIFEDKRNCIIYQMVEDELHKLEDSISMYNQDNLEDMTHIKVDNGIENISYKIECLEQDDKFTYLDDEYIPSRKVNENRIKNIILNYLGNYKANIVNNLVRNGYSQNTIDSIEEQIEKNMYKDYANILAEKITQDGIKNLNLLDESLKDLTNNTLEELEERYNCQKNGIVYDEFKEKRAALKEKAKKINYLMSQIDMIDKKISKITPGKVIINNN